LTKIRPEKEEGRKSEVRITRVTHLTAQIAPSSGERGGRDESSNPPPPRKRDEPNFPTLKHLLEIGEGGESVIFFRILDRWGLGGIKISKRRASASGDLIDERTCPGEGKGGES